MTPRAASLLAIAAMTACGDSYMVVTVQARPAVVGAATLTVVEQNGGSMRTDTFDLGTRTFPVTFSIDAHGRSGPIDIAITATGSDGLLVGLGSGAPDADAGAATIMLDPADFVVNTDYDGDQYVTTDYETKGYQLAATDGGPWTVAFREDCTTCEIYGRMFDQTGQPITTQVAASTSQFTLTTAATDPDGETFPAVAAAGASTVAVWDYTSGSGGIACRSISAAGALDTNQVTISTDATADAVTVAPLSNGEFAVGWQTTSPAAIRTAIIKADCTTVSAPATASTVVGTTEGPHRVSIANNASNAAGDSVLYAWVTDTDVHVRAGTTSGTFTGADTVLYPSPTTFQISIARVSPMGDGFAVAVRSITPDEMSAGMIQLIRTNAAGQIIGTPTLISNVTGADFSVGSQGFTNATRGSDGATLIAWQQCSDGSAAACTGAAGQDIYGRLVRPTGAPVGDAFMIPSTTENDQGSPAGAALDGAFAVAWNDSSSTAPDTSGTAVRARVIYPAFDDATLVLSAACKTSADCNSGLACAMHSDGQTRCSLVCTPPTCAAGGTCSASLDANVSACVY